MILPITVSIDTNITEVELSSRVKCVGVAFVVFSAHRAVCSNARVRAYVLLIMTSQKKFAKAVFPLSRIMSRTVIGPLTTVDRTSSDSGK